jgi:hypothetical protein
MRSFQMILICLSALGFVLAVITSLAGGPIVFGVTAEGFSFACADLALIAIALSLYGRSKE